MTKREQQQQQQQRQTKKMSKSAKKSSVSSSSTRSKGTKYYQKREVVFDPEARKSYLRGFSERKRQRRAYGLAMQKVKDRKAKIQQRAEQKKNELQQIEQMERQKEELLEEVVVSQRQQQQQQQQHPTENESESDSDDERYNQTKSKKVNVIDTTVYDDSKTEMTWGGPVTVSVVQLGDDNDDDEEEDDINDHDNSNSHHKNTQKSVDVAQRYAGNVQRYLDKLKGNMPSKRSNNHNNSNSTHKARRKGRNGAVDMKGVGGSANLKIASKLLNKSKIKNQAAGSNKNSSIAKKGKKTKEVAS